ncbi:MAG: hypothetical protein RJA99_2555 [Pseudomonadota bacterium]
MHACVVCWTGREQAARAIASGLRDRIDQLTVVYSNGQDREEGGAGDWVKVPDAWFYGRKFRRLLDAHRGGVLLLVQADAQCDDWGALARRCAEVFAADPGLGVWAPDIDYTPFTIDLVQVRPLPGKGLCEAVHTDGIVWAIAEPVVQRLRRMDYDCNNLGWGIDWAALAFARTARLRIVRDRSLHVRHPKGSGYAARAAREQMGHFLAQLTPPERRQVALLRARIGLARARRRLLRLLPMRTS